MLLKLLRACTVRSLRKRFEDSFKLHECIDDLSGAAKNIQISDFISSVSFGAAKEYSFCGLSTALYNFVQVQKITPRSFTGLAKELVV